MPPATQRDDVSLLKIYETLHDHFGDLHWWPGDSPFEVIVGAILTQNTTWKNVEAAIRRLKAEDLLHPARLRPLTDLFLADRIRSAGYHRVKTKRLKAFLHFLYQNYQDDLEVLFSEDLWILREKLLLVHGIGEETADSILLYAGGKPIFVVDAYTRRIMQRHHIISDTARYEDVQALFMAGLPRSAPLYNQYHALMVNTGKHFCRKQNPKCEICPLHAFL
ncbi:MAG: endonuclease III domain-containing protein [Candidatus Omnitrophica bacterium]|nr:endonuclease III domain-containing protein [Candidatus Omnitrophota bacterium]